MKLETFISGIFVFIGTIAAFISIAMQNFIDAIELFSLVVILINTMALLERS